MVRAFILGTMIALIAATVGHTAGVIDLPRTGQTKCYDAAGTQITCSGTGQDGDIQAGVSWPDPRFTVSDDCVVDNLTGLMWSKNAFLLGGGKTWNDAIDWANDLTLCGYSDWRLPNVNELESLTNMDVSSIPAWLNSNGFTNVQSSWYWSSTAEYSWLHFVDAAWIVYMNYNGVNSDPMNASAQIWPVRAGESGPSLVWRTGQTTKYRTGDDGDLQKGVAWPSPRFVEEGDCVTDNLTGLMWSKDANANGQKTWQEALDYASSLTLCGHSDWRLPNRKELMSLVDRSRNNPALPAYHPFINVLSSSDYWSSTTHPRWKHCASYVNMWEGIVSALSKADNNYCGIWPVRAGDVESHVVLSVLISGSGTVTSDPSGIACGVTCSASFTAGTTVTLTASPAAGSTFTSWTGCDGSSASKTTRSGRAARAASTCTVTMSAAKSVTANFTLDTKTLTVTKAGTGSGTVTATGAGITCTGSTCTGTYSYGASVVITATAATGSNFTTFTGCDSTSGNTCTVAMTSHRSVIATFTSTNPCTYTISPTTKSVTNKGGSTNVTVKATGATSCASPTVSSGSAWINAASGSFTKNKGTVKVTVSANSTVSTRTGTVTIQGSAFTATQAGSPCTLTSISPTKAALTKTGGTGSFSVTATTGCGWKAEVASTAASWLSATPPTGSGSGTVTYSGSANATKKPRNGKITVYLTDTPTKKKIFTVTEGK